MILKEVVLHHLSEVLNIACGRPDSSNHRVNELELFVVQDVKHWVVFHIKRDEVI